MDRLHLLFEKGYDCFHPIFTVNINKHNMRLWDIKKKKETFLLTTYHPCIYSIPSCLTSSPPSPLKLCDLMVCTKLQNYLMDNSVKVLFQPFSCASPQLTGTPLTHSQTHTSTTYLSGEGERGRARQGSDQQQWHLGVIPYVWRGLEIKSDGLAKCLLLSEMD